jgi:hypothetical protein
MPVIRSAACLFWRGVLLAGVSCVEISALYDNESNVNIAPGATCLGALDPRSPTLTQLAATCHATVFFAN